jgi:hypothetical protein
MRILGLFMALPSQYVSLRIILARIGRFCTDRTQRTHKREFRYDGVRTANNFTEISSNATQYPSTVSLECSLK